MTGNITSNESTFSLINNDIRFKTSGAETMLRAVTNGAVELMYDNSTKIATESGGVHITGYADADNFKIAGAQGSDGQVLTSTGSGVAWEDSSGGVAGITSAADATAIAISSSENSTFSGHIYANANNTYDLGATATRWRNIYTNDLQLSNEGGDANEVDGTHGSWTIQEGEEDLFIINRKSGKKYKFKLEEM